MSDFTSWHVGMRVACITRPAPTEPPPYPALNKVYTLSKIWKARDLILVDLVELPAKPTLGYFTGYRAAAFRPVQTRKTDISVFTALLTPTKERERA
jgi:hypothetical protein